MKKNIALSLLFGLLGLPLVANAEPSIFLNDVDITGVTNQQFKDVTVEFDDKGNVHLIAPQYHIVDTTAEGQATKGKVVDGPKVETLPANQSAVYLIAAFNKPGLFGYNIHVYLNGEYITEISQGKAQSHVDLTGHLKHGLNRIEYRMKMAADSGTSIRAEADMFLSTMTGLQADSIEMSGQYARVLIKGSEGAKNYVAEFIVP